MNEELSQNIRSFWNSAELIYKTKDYTSATLLYFKCWFVTLDYIIYQSKRFTPKDHSERFQILEKEFKNKYKQIDKYYSIYRQTYSLTIDKSKCEIIRKIVRELLDEYQLIKKNRSIL
jgi:DNA-binding ferritin-like protein (Dps family)